MSVLSDAGSDLPADSDKVAAVRAALLDEAVENALVVASWDAGQSRFRTDSEITVPLLVDERSRLGDVVRPDTV